VRGGRGRNKNEREKRARMGRGRKEKKGQICGLFLAACDHNSVVIVFFHYSQIVVNRVQE